MTESRVAMVRGRYEKGWLWVVGWGSHWVGWLTGGEVGWTWVCGDHGVGRLKGHVGVVADCPCSPSHGRLPRARSK
jgi:hypothetical protein